MSGPKVHVPPELPDILKQFTKIAIKSQPKDILAWSAAYFRALANGEQPPSKSSGKGDNHLSPGLLKILNKQLGPRKNVSCALLKDKWSDMALSEDQLQQLVLKGKFEATVNWIQFFGLCCISIAGNIPDAMRLACEVLASDGDGRIPFQLFMDTYNYIAFTEGGKGDTDKIRAYLKEKAAKQNGYIMPKNFLTSDCPSLTG